MTQIYPHSSLFRADDPSHLSPQTAPHHLCEGGSRAKGLIIRHYSSSFMKHLVALMDIGV